MDSLVSILQDELIAVCKELKEVTTAATEKAVCMAQPLALQTAAAAVVENQYLASPPMMNVLRCHRKRFCGINRVSLWHDAPLGQNYIDLCHVILALAHYCAILLQYHPFLPLKMLQTLTKEDFI